MEQPYNKQIVDEIRSCLEEIPVHFDFVEESGFFFFETRLDGAIPSVAIFVNVRNDSFVVHAALPVSVDVEDDVAVRNVTEYLCRVNYSLMCGYFELDMSSGKIWHKVYVPCRKTLREQEVGDEASEQIVSKGALCQSLIVPQKMIMRFGSGLVDVIYGVLSPEDAFRRADDEQSEPDADF